MLDTQILIWWTTEMSSLSARHARLIDEGEPEGVAVSGFSAWEVAMLVGKGRIGIREPLQGWLDRVLSIPTLHVLPVTPQILIDSTCLPGEFHPDPADRIIVATARANGLPLLTTDRKILGYSHVRAIGPD